MTFVCPYCGQEWDEDPDLLRIYLGEGCAHCYECDRDFDIEATEVECRPCED
jgi:transcription elongation factor Elf1